MSISAETLLLLAVVLLAIWNIRLSIRLDELNRDCIQVLTATKVAMERIPFDTNQMVFDLRRDFSAARDLIIQKIETLTRK